MVITDAEGKLGLSKMRFGDGYIMVGSEWTGYVASPASIGGKNTQTIHVQLKDGLDPHCERARAAGAEIVREPEDQFYGDRVYTAKDPEGHVWSFGQTVRRVSREEAEKASGLKIEGGEGSGGDRASATPHSMVSNAEAHCAAAVARA